MITKSNKPTTINPVAIHAWPLLTAFDVTFAYAIDRVVRINTRSIVPGTVNVFPKTKFCQKDCHYINSFYTHFASFYLCFNAFKALLG